MAKIFLPICLVMCAFIAATSCVPLSKISNQRKIIRKREITGKQSANNWSTRFGRASRGSSWNWSTTKGSTAGKRQDLQGDGQTNSRDSSRINVGSKDRRQNDRLNKNDLKVVGDGSASDNQGLATNVGKRGQERNFTTGRDGTRGESSVNGNSRPITGTGRGRGRTSNGARDTGRGRDRTSNGARDTDLDVEFNVNTRDSGFNILNTIGTDSANNPINIGDSVNSTGGSSRRRGR